MKSDDKGEKSPDEEEFASLVHRQSRFVFRIAYAILRNVSDAEDVVQEVFLKLYGNGVWREMRDEKAFLARTSWRMAVEQLPRRKRQESHSKAAFDELASEALNPEQETIEADWNRHVHLLMDALPEELRQPLALSTLEELSSPEIAGVMGIPEGTVRTRLMKAKQLLKQKLEATCGGRHAK